MSNYVSINRIMNHACGVGAARIGIPMGVYRLSNASNGDYIQPSNLLFSIHADRAQMRRDDPAFESSLRLETYWFELLINSNPLVLGDILVSQDRVYNQGAQIVEFPSDQFIGFCMAGMPPIKHAIAARLDINALIFTPSLAPSKEIGGVPYFDTTTPQDLPIVCKNGIYAPGLLTDVPSAVPVGTMPMNNGGSIYSSATANMPTQERRRVYIPPLPGYTPRAGDKLVLESGSRYVLLSNYTQLAGTVGTQALVEKIVTGGAG